jgi:hypothetical protein
MRKIISILFFMIAHISLLHAAEEPILKGVEEIKAAMSQHPIQKTILIIGVRPGEDNFHERFDHLIQDPHIFPVFADSESAIEPFSGHFLQGKSFDDEVVLQEVRDKFPETFDIIITDGSDTTKFLSNTAKHLDILYAALRPGGSLFSMGRV